MSTTPETTPSVPDLEGRQAGEDVTPIDAQHSTIEAGPDRSPLARLVLVVLVVLVALVILGVLGFGGWLLIAGRDEDVKVLGLLLGALATLVGALAKLCVALR